MPETYITPRANQLDVLEQIAANTKIASDMLTDPVPTPAQGLTDAHLRATALPTTDSLGGTRTHNTAGGIRQAVGATSARVVLPTLSASREVYVMATQRCFFITGDSSVTAVNTTGLTNMSHPLAADERFYFRVPAGHTHIAYIRESADGFISIIPVA